MENEDSQHRAVSGQTKEILPLSDEILALFTRYINQSDNLKDNLRRAELMGFGGRDIRIAPGAVIRVNPDLIEENVFIGLYSYLNGKVRVGRNVQIGPHCSLPAGNHKFDPATGWFSARTEQDRDESIVIGRAPGCPAESR
jgi:acetyltransferase-like isoleucine patch superfamily enzyme